MGPLDDFDRVADARLTAHRSPTLDRVMYGLSSAADHGLLWLAIGALRAARRGDPAYLGRLALAMGAESAITNGAVKSLFRRVRPPDRPTDDEPLPYDLHRPITSAFPSGHAASAFTAATVLSTGSRMKPLWYALAATVAASRAYVRLHHTSDVVAGTALGLALGRAARCFVEPGAAQR